MIYFVFGIFVLLIGIFIVLYEIGKEIGYMNEINERKEETLRQILDEFQRVNR